ncbi:MAG: molybdopterin-dependent oxidoreductase [Desulfobacterales bacterium]
MKTRRGFFKTVLKGLTGAALFFSPLYTLVQKGYAGAKKIVLPENTRMKSLINKDPANLDTRNLEITPLAEFDTMGLSDFEIDPGNWRLHVEGEVDNPLELTYRDVMSLPSVEREVLLICPGYFALHGRWQGVDMQHLLKKAECRAKASRVSFSGPSGKLNKSEQFPIEEVETGRVFVAYGVNGRELPQKHGFPLRLVAGDHYGYRWVKYVDRMTVS